MRIYTGRRSFAFLRSGADAGEEVRVVSARVWVGEDVWRGGERSGRRILWGCSGCVGGGSFAVRRFYRSAAVEGLTLLFEFYFHLIVKSKKCSMIKCKRSYVAYIQC